MSVQGSKHEAESVTSGSCSRAARVGKTMNLACQRINDNRVGNSQPVDRTKVVAHGYQLGASRLRPRLTFEQQDVGKPLVMGSRGVDGRARVKAELECARMTQSVVLGMVRPPGDPVTILTLPSRSTIVGVMELSIRFPGAMMLAGVPIRPDVSVRPGIKLKSPISLFSRNPAPATTAFAP